MREQQPAVLGIVPHHGKIAVLARELRPGHVTFSWHDITTQVADQAPDYPMMLILGLFDFPTGPAIRPMCPISTFTELTGTDVGTI